VPVGAPAVVEPSASDPTTAVDGTEDDGTEDDGDGACDTEATPASRLPTPRASAAVPAVAVRVNLMIPPGSGTRSVRGRHRS
jgi:hypothetical protein